MPLLSIIDDKKLRTELRDVARDYHKEFIIDRGMDIEAQVLEVIKDLFVRSEKGVLSVKNITGAFINRYGDEYEKTISAKWIGTIIRKRLHVKTQKSRGVFVIPLSEKPKLDLLWEKFGIAKGEAQRSQGEEAENGEEAETRTATGDVVSRFHIPGVIPRVGVRLFISLQRVEKVDGAHDGNRFIEP